MSHRNPARIVLAAVTAPSHEVAATSARYEGFTHKINPTSVTKQAITALSPGLYSGLSVALNSWGPA